MAAVSRRTAMVLSGRRRFAVLAHSWAAAGHGAGAGLRPAAKGRGQEDPRRVCVMLHGILGSKANWNTPARRLLQQIGPKGWAVLQLDHRAHGQSPRGEAPHSLEACAADVLETLAAAGVRIGEDELVVCGHSFGGKVALSVLRLLVERAAPPRKTWLFDSVPGRPARREPEEHRREQSVDFVLSAVEAAAARGAYADRGALVEALQAEHGLAKPLAQWVAQSVKDAPGGVELGYCVRTVRELYEAYRDTCMWEVLEAGYADVGVVIAGRNKHAWGEENLQRLEGCRRVQVVELEAAGHNVHVDDLQGLLTALEPTFA